MAYGMSYATIEKKLVTKWFCFQCTKEIDNSPKLNSKEYPKFFFMMIQVG
jgi:hypothetical protein